MISLRLPLPDLPRDAWIVLAGDALSATGSGLTIPYLLIFLHSARGLDLALASMALMIYALSGFAGNPIGGSLADRYGARNALICGAVLAACGASGMILVHTSWQAATAAAVAGFGIAVIAPAQDALLASLVGPGQRSVVFSVRHATLNAGLGVGAVIASMILAGGSSSRFVVLFLVDGATFLALVPLLLIFKIGTRSKARSNTAPLMAGSAGYKFIFRDTLFLRIWLLMAVLVTIGFAQLHASFPVFATKPGGITASALGIAYAANAFTVVTAQLFVLKAAQGHRRTTAVMMVCALWATAWAITLLAGSLGSGWLAIGSFTVALVVFGLGETAFTPTLTPMVNDLAPEALRGRYNGALATAWTAGFVLGPAVAGKTLAMGFGNAMYVVLICLLAVVALAAWRLSRLLPGRADEIGYGLGGQQTSDPGELGLPLRGVPNVS